MTKTVFEMDEVESQRANEWIEAQIQKSRDAGQRNLDATGFRFGFLFFPTTLGNCVKVRDAMTGEEKDVTNADNW